MNNMSIAIIVTLTMAKLIFSQPIHLINSGDENYKGNVSSLISYGGDPHSYAFGISMNAIDRFGYVANYRRTDSSHLMDINFYTQLPFSYSKNILSFYSIGVTGWRDGITDSSVSVLQSRFQFIYLLKGKLHPTISLISEVYDMRAPPSDDITNTLEIGLVTSSQKKKLVTSSQ